MENNMLSGFNESNAFVAQHDETEKPEYTRADAVISVFAMIAAFCFVRYVLFHVTGFVTTGLFIAVISAAIIYLKKKECEFSRFNKLLACGCCKRSGVLFHISGYFLNYSGCRILRAIV